MKSIAGKISNISVAAMTRLIVFTVASEVVRSALRIVAKTVFDACADPVSIA
jgi:hypothetical protein